MTSIEGLDRFRTGTWLRDNPVAAHLGSDESVEHVLTNREVGLRRTTDGEETRIRPAEDCGAVALLSDRRVLFLVGDPSGHGGDLAESVPYEGITDAVAETETLTQRVLVEHDATTYAFTARETDAVEDVQSFLETASEVYTVCKEHLTTAADARDRLEDATQSRDWDACDDAEDAARDALTLVRTRIEGTPFDPLRDRVADLTAETDERARIRHRRQAEELADESETLLADHEYEASHERIRAAREHAATAVTLADERAAAADGGTDGGVAVVETKERVETLATTITSRPVTDGEDYYERAATAEDRAERIDALESAFECYRSAATLLSDDDSPFDGDEGAAREDAERVIADLLECHHDAARDERAAGEWERDADNPRSAYELLSDARAHAERALELARAYPPGDVATLEAEVEGIESGLDPLRIEAELTDAGE